MGKFTVGSIILVNFPFSNLAGAKKRPALVLACVDKNDYILLQITSRAWADPHSIRITTNDYSMGALPLESYIRPGKLFTGNDTIILRSVAQVAPHIMEKVRQTLIGLIEHGSFNL